MDKKAAYEEGMRANSRLAAELEKLARLRTQYRIDSQTLNALESSTERSIIEQAGGDKALGSNDAARKRELTLQLEEDVAYTSFRTKVNELYLQLMLQEGFVEAIRREVRLHTALAGGYSLLVTPSG